MLYPLKFKPLYKERIWGGNLIKNYLKRNIDVTFTQIGEAWDICDREEDQSIVENGHLKGQSLKDLRLKFQHNLVGNKIDYTLNFPILVKILDAKEDLSLQVHPKKSDLLKLEKGAASKTEFWYILKTQENAKIMAGLKIFSKEKFEENIASKNIRNFVNIYDVKENDLLYINSGTIHAIGAGNLILEIQENSDTTYRVSDWERLDNNGKKRELHIKESMICIDFEDKSPIALSHVDLNKNYNIVKSPLFNTSSNFLNGTVEQSTGSDSCAIISVTNGYLTLSNVEGILETITLNQGESALLPANCKYRIFSNNKANYLLTSIV